MRRSLPDGVDKDEVPTTLLVPGIKKFSMKSKNHLNTFTLFQIHPVERILPTSGGGCLINGMDSFTNSSLKRARSNNWTRNAR